MIHLITGTDTGVGKTVVTATLVTTARQRGRSAYVVKPAQTGVVPEDPTNPTNPGGPTDLAEIRRLVGGVPGHEGVTLPEPLAPEAAARLAGMALPSLSDQLAGIDSAARWHQETYVEGAGGLRVPLGHGWDLLDLADGLRSLGHDLGFVVVARAGLGTLNHAMLTVAAIVGRDHAVTGLVVGSMPAEPDAATRENLADLPRLTGVPLLGSVPEGAAALSPEQFRNSAPRWLDLA